MYKRKAKYKHSFAYLELLFDVVLAVLVHTPYGDHTLQIPRDEVPVLGELQGSDGATRALLKG